MVHRVRWPSIRRRNAVLNGVGGHGEHQRQKVRLVHMVHGVHRICIWISDCSGACAAKMTKLRWLVGELPALCII